MRRSARFFLLSLVLATLMLASALPAHAADQPVHLLGAKFITGSGLVVYFDIDEGFDLAQVNKSVDIDGVRYPLDCRTNSNDKLVCLADVKKPETGQRITIYFGRFIFSEIQIRVCSRYTYSIFDYDQSYSWHTIGEHRQVCQAELGDSIMFTSPDWGDTLPHYFSTDGADRCAPDMGRGYYFWAGYCF